MNLYCHPENVVVAMKLPYIDRITPEGLENAVGGNDTNRVCTSLQLGKKTVRV